MNRGQINLIALFAIAFVVFVIIYMGFNMERAEIDQKKNLEDSSFVKISLQKHQDYMNGLLKDVMYQTADEMAQHGGFTLENVPFRKHMGISYWFYQGNIVNIPTVTAMEQMFAEEVERRINSELNIYKDFLKEKHGIYEFGTPDVTIVLEESSIKATALQHISVEEKDKIAKTKLEFQMNIPVRLRKLRDLAEQYVLGYSSARIIESSLMAGIRNDDRIYEPPGRPMHSVSCKNPPYKSFKEMIAPVKENFQISVARELQRIRVLFNESKFLEWNMELKPSEVEFSFVADNGEYGYETERIYLVPTMLAPFSPKSDICISSYLVTYNIFAPVRYSITDLLPTAKLVGALGEGLIKPLTFHFYMMPYLGSQKDGSADPFAKDETVGDPPHIDSICQGSCSLSLTMINSQQGRIWIDNCDYSYKTESAHFKEIPCGIRDLVIESFDPLGLSRYVEEVNFKGDEFKTIELPELCLIEGDVFSEVSIYCTQSNKVETKEAFKKLGFQDGTPPRYIEIVLQPLNPKLGQPIKIRADADGHYKAEHLTPGKYMLLARPSKDASGISGYKVEPEASIIDIGLGINEKDIIMKSLNIMLIKGKYYHISDVEAC